MQDSYHSFKSYASGRINCNYCVTVLELAKRQDALTKCVLFSVVPFDDIVRLEIPIDTVDTVSFCLCRKRDQKAILAKSSDLRTTCRARKVDDMPANLVVLSDSAETVAAVLKEPVMKVLKAHE